MASSFVSELASSPSARGDRGVVTVVVDVVVVVDDDAGVGALTAGRGKVVLICDAPLNNSRCKVTPITATGVL